MNKKNTLNIGLIFLVILFSINFFEFKGIKDFSNLKYIQFVFLAIVELVSIRFFFTVKDKFSLPVQLIVISMVISLFMANYSWDQGLGDSIIATVPLMLWLFYFYLKQIQLSIESIERIVIFFGSIYIALYFFQIFNLHTVYFGWNDEFDETRGIARIFLGGSGLFYLSIFIALTKLTETTKRSSFFLVFVILGVIVPIMQVTRQFIFSVLIIYVFHFLKGKKTYITVLGLTFIIGGIIIFINTDNKIVKGLMEAQEQTVDDGDNYIRILAGSYFLNEFSPNIGSKILGNGVPYGAKGDYAKFVTNDLMLDKHFFLSDVGIIAVYVMFGLLSIVGFFLIFIKSFIIPLPSQYYYLKYYLWFLLFTCITSFSVYHYNYLIANVLTVYLYSRIASNKLITE